MTLRNKRQDISHPTPSREEMEDPHWLSALASVWFLSIKQQQVELDHPRPWLRCPFVTRNSRKICWVTTLPERVF